LSKALKDDKGKWEGGRKKDMSVKGEMEWLQKLKTTALGLKPSTIISMVFG
jgi:hypothetical protein